MIVFPLNGGSILIFLALAAASVTYVSLYVDRFHLVLFVYRSQST